MMKTLIIYFYIQGEQMVIREKSWFYQTSVEKANYVGQYYGTVTFIITNGHKVIAKKFFKNLWQVS